MVDNGYINDAALPSRARDCEIGASLLYSLNGHYGDGTGGFAITEGTTCDLNNVTTQEQRRRVAKESRRITRCKSRTTVRVVRRGLYRVAFTSRIYNSSYIITMRLGLSYHDGHTALADAVARFLRWHSKIAAPPFPEGSFRSLSLSLLFYY